MDFMKECVWRIKRKPGQMEEISGAITLQAKIKAIDNAISNLNISKASLKQYTREEISRLFYMFQNIGIELNICEHYRSFFSNKNKKYHQICEGTRSKIQTQCFGDRRKCTFGFFDTKCKLLKGPEQENKKRNWDKL